MKCLIHIILTSKKPKERDEVKAIKKQIEKLLFCMHTGCAMQDFAYRQLSFESYAV